MANAADITQERKQVLAASMDPMAIIEGERYVSVNQPYADLYGVGHPDDILTSGQIADGQGRFCIEAPQTTDIRQLSARLQTEYPDSTLVAQREFDRPAQKAREIRQSVSDELTSRQREVLTRAYHAGYFDWPRQSTAGNIAASMDVAETTFHYHLRNALETVSSILVGLERHRE